MEKQTRSPRQIKAGVRTRSRDNIIVTKTTYNKRQVLSPVALYRASGFERVEIIRQGLPADILEQIVHKMGISKECLYTALRFPPATIKRKIRNHDKLSVSQTERLIGLESLVGQVEEMVALSGNPKGFNVNHWFGKWVDHPLPALGGAKPADFMDTMEGQKLISKLLAQTQSGAYA